MALDGGSPFAIFTSSLDALDRPGTSGDALTLSPSTKSGFCAYNIYADEIGKLVVPPTKTPLYFPQAQVTNLTASTFGNTPPTPNVAVPQCNFAVSGNGSMLESLGSTDCIVARAVATIPSGCDAVCGRPVNICQRRRNKQSPPVGVQEPAKLGQNLSRDNKIVRS